MTPKERAEILYNKYSEDYLKFVLKSYKKQSDKEHWIEVANELNKLYQLKKK